MTEFLDGSESPVRYSDRKAQVGPRGAPWPLEDLVTAQQMDCAGIPREEIAAELGRGLDEVNRKLDGDVGAETRPDRAAVGFPALKVR